MQAKNGNKFSPDWKLVVAIIALFVAIFVALYGSGQCQQASHPSWITPFLDLVCPKPTSTSPTSGGNTSPTAPQTISTATAPLETYLAKEDFEDGNVQIYEFSGGSSEWKIVSDEAGNMVYEVDNQNGSGYPSVSFGSPDWGNYAIEYRVRYLNNKGSVGLQFRSNGKNFYVLDADVGETYLAYSENSSDWTRLKTIFPPININTWHTIRIEALDEQIRIYFDDALWINESDARFRHGGLLLFASPNTYAQVDDISIWQLGNQ